MHPLPRKNKQPAYIECPFCSGLVKPENGMSTCPECSAVFRFDDRLECIFVALSDMRLPLVGTVCVRCGMVQDTEEKTCGHCNALLCKTVH